jgi:hypothetical protein
MEYAENSSFSPLNQGSSAPISISPGSDLYFRSKPTSGAFKSVVQHLVIPVRPAAPEILIDYVNENTAIISSSLEWSPNASMSSSVPGQGSGVPVTPGTDLYFRTIATSGAFKSNIRHLIVPARPLAPIFTINYTLKKTSEPVSANDDYSTSSDMSGASAGSNAAISLTPGTDLYFRTRATSSSFRSAIQHLAVPSVPAPPVFTINYNGGTTNETAGTNIAISTHSNFSDIVYGAGTAVTLEPGQDLYFKQVAGGSSFGSDAAHLVVPGCNFLGYSGADTITSNKFTLYAILTDPSYEMTLDDISVTNGTAQNLRAGNVFDVYPSVKGPVTVVIPANAVAANTFASNDVTVYYNVVTGIDDYEKDNISIYPNPSDDGIIYVQTHQNRPCLIGIYSVDGHLMRTIEIHDGGTKQINLSDFQKGMYFLKISSQNNSGVYKIILN